jgi:hypothetical protein
VEETRKALSLLSDKGGEVYQAETSLRVKLWRRLALALLYQVYRWVLHGELRLRLFSMLSGTSAAVVIYTQ